MCRRVVPTRLHAVTSQAITQPLFLEMYGKETGIYLIAAVIPLLAIIHTPCTYADANPVL